MLMLILMLSLVLLWTFWQLLVKSFCTIKSVTEVCESKVISLKLKMARAPTKKRIYGYFRKLLTSPTLFRYHASPAKTTTAAELMDEMDGYVGASEDKMHN
mmetsp:Transcript_4198/g.6138  ORF Transcript_4198/g.6138 Transcript_4198/m.6138 type:complete len:101 (-) Transcript_4198:59-361(-)